MELKEKQVYQILSKQNRFAIAVEKASTENGALIKLAADTGVACVPWVVQVVEGAWLKLVNDNSGKLLGLVSCGCREWNLAPSMGRRKFPRSALVCGRRHRWLFPVKIKKIWPLC